MPLFMRKRIPPCTPLVTIKDDEEDEEWTSSQETLSREQTFRLILDQPEYRCMISDKQRNKSIPSVTSTKSVITPVLPRRAEEILKAPNKHLKFADTAETESTSGASNYQSSKETFRTRSAPPGYSDTASVISGISGDFRRRNVTFHYNGLGLGQVYLQMPDIIHKNLSRTLHMSYSSSVLNTNPKTLTDDIIRLSIHKGSARNSIVNKIERRLETMKQRRSAYQDYMGKKNSYRQAFANKIDPFNQLRKKSLSEEEKQRFGQMDSEKVLTVAERSMERKDRVILRTEKMLPNQRVTQRKRLVNH